jgi:hypothetical protein
LGAVSETVIKVSEATAEMFMRAGSSKTFCKDEENGAASSSEILVNTHHSTRRHTPEGQSITLRYRGEQRIVWKCASVLRYKGIWVKFQTLKVFSRFVKTVLISRSLRFSLAHSITKIITCGQTKQIKINNYGGVRAFTRILTADMAMALISISLSPLADRE